MRSPKFLRNVDSLFEQIRQRPAWVRTLLIIGIALVASWLVAQGIQRGLDTSGLVPLYEGADEGNPWRDEYNAEYRRLIWQQYGLQLTALAGLMVAILIHSLVGDPTLYSYMGRIALGLQSLTVLALFDGSCICIFGSLATCYLPLTMFVGLIHVVRSGEFSWPPPGDWAIFLLFLVYAYYFTNFNSSWGSAFFD